MRLVNITNVYCVMTSWYLVERVDIVKRLEARCIKVSFKTELEMIIIQVGDVNCLACVVDPCICDALPSFSSA